MTFQYACSTVIEDCEDVVVGESRDEVAEAAAEHVRQEHGMVELPHELTARVLAAIDPSK